MPLLLSLPLLLLLPLLLVVVLREAEGSAFAVVFAFAVSAIQRIWQSQEGNSFEMNVYAALDAYRRLNLYRD